VAAFIVSSATKGVPGLRGLTGRLFRWRIGVLWLLVALFSPVAL
jgi:hypothetical protein